MEDAVAQIRDYISGDRNARIECDDEGELYRLFHEVNSLAAILNAQAENEGKSRKFLQNTISDISHQLKTQLASLNIYNGIIQSGVETDDLPTVRELSCRAVIPPPFFVTHIFKRFYRSRYSKDTQGIWITDIWDCLEEGSFPQNDFEIMLSSNIKEDMEVLLY